MVTFTWDGQEFELVQRPLVAELRALRKWLGDDADAFDNVIGTIAVSIKRARPGFDLRAVDAWEAEDLIAISNELEAQAAAANTADVVEATAPAVEDAEPAIYAGLPDEQVPPTGGGSAPNVQPPQAQPAPANA